jgi:hypothetical protein
MIVGVKPSNATTPCWNNRPWRHNLTQTASGNPGAVQGPLEAIRERSTYLKRARARTSEITYLSVNGMPFRPQTMDDMFSPCSHYTRSR